MIYICDKKFAAHGLLLEMAFQTKRLVAFRQHPLIDRTMGRMAGHTSFAHSLVLEHKRTSLRGVTLETGFVLAQQGHTAAFERLWKVRSAPFDRVSFVRVMTIGATHFPFQHRMVMRQIEFRPYLQMALETGGRRSSRIDDRARSAAALDV